MACMFTWLSIRQEVGVTCSSDICVMNTSSAPVNSTECERFAVGKCQGRKSFSFQEDFPWKTSSMNCRHVDEQGTKIPLLVLTYSDFL